MVSNLYPLEAALVGFAFLQDQVALSWQVERIRKGGRGMSERVSDDRVAGLKLYFRTKEVLDEMPGWEEDAEDCERRRVEAAMCRMALSCLDELQSLRVELAERREAERWIPTSERLPEEGVTVWALLFEDGHCRIVPADYDYSESAWWIHKHDGYLCCNVSQWRQRRR